MFRAIRRFFDPLKNTVNAAEWLKRHGEKCTFAGNRFQSTAEALRFVESLFAAGAEAVVIPTNKIRTEAWRIEQESGPYADSLLIKLPASAAQRQAIWPICDKEYARELDDWELSPPDYIPSRGIVHLSWD